MLLREVFDSIPLTWRMEQWPEEIEALAELVRAKWNHIPATHVVELGVRHGGTSVLWHQLLPEAKVIGVDRIGHDSYHEPEFSQRARQMETDYPRFKFIEGDTQSIETLGKVVAEVGAGSIGFLFIDADHSYRAVSRDYERFGRLVVPGGLIAFHDIVDSERTGGGVSQLWKEFEDDSKIEFCCGGDWGGIGVIQK